MPIETYKAPGHKSSTRQGSYMRDESAGVKTGTSTISEFDSENTNDPNVNHSVDAKTGQYRGNIKPRSGTSVKSKGVSFDIC